MISVPAEVGNLTFNANLSMLITELIKAKFSHEVYGNAVPRQIMVAPHDGPSTDGGRKARQPLILESISGDGRKIVCGFLDVSQSVAEVRSFMMVAHQFESRYGIPIDIESHHYERLQADLCRFFESQSIATSINDDAPLPDQSQMQASAQEAYSMPLEYEEVPLETEEPTSQDMSGLKMAVMGLIAGLGMGLLINVM